MRWYLKDNSILNIINYGMSILWRRDEKRFCSQRGATYPARGFLYWNDDVNKAAIVSNGLRLYADQFDKLGLALTKAYMCDTYVTDE